MASARLQPLDRPLYDEDMKRRLHSPMTLALYEMQRRFGWRRAIWMLDFLASWAIAVRHNEWRPITPEEFATYWGRSRAWGYRERQLWRAAFEPEEAPDPNVHVLAAREQYEALVAEQEREPKVGDVATLMATIPLGG